MKQLIEEAAEKVGRHPEMVVAGHVHNYQRFTKTMDGGAQVPYLVTGAGGYYHLHAMQKVNGPADGGAGCLQRQTGRSNDP